MSGAIHIALERVRQIDVEGWTPSLDDRHVRAELARAAAAYLLVNVAARQGAWARDLFLPKMAADLWPFDARGFKPKTELENLERAGALIAAEIDRINRRRDGDTPRSRGPRATTTLEELIPAAARALSLMQAMGWRDATQTDGLDEDSFVEALAAETAYRELRDALPTAAVFGGEMVRDPLAAARTEAAARAAAAKEADA